VSRRVSRVTWDLWQVFAFGHCLTVAFWRTWGLSWERTKP
jgi:hypothetical protein